MHNEIHKILIYSYLINLYMMASNNIYINLLNIWPLVKSTKKFLKEIK